MGLAEGVPTAQPPDGDLVHRLEPVGPRLRCREAGTSMGDDILSQRGFTAQLSADAEGDPAKIFPAALFGLHYDHAAATRARWPMSIAMRSCFLC